MGFAVPAHHRVKIKESKKGDKWTTKIKNMNLRVTPLVVRALGIILERLVKIVEDLEIRAQVQNIQATALLWSATILSWVLET